ncbi:tellurium resistance protein [Candidatus Thiomargarita nelsonii]|uniref:Tellurium resistance protein n=1 Tax=Candidatus Thiomargarita nelsonii TaxID=1003181 RepID=A0A0A6PIH3_9GAMM|nr:tellurium resistance protein [Candidatus Thiomargarita nelsonii]
MKNKRPGGKLATRPLHFIWLADCSGSMSVDGKIQALNTAIREAIPHMQRVADDNPNADVLVRAIKFSNGAQWHISRAMPIADFKWLDLTCDGLTDMGNALSMLAEQLKIPPMTDRALPPVLVLISDGEPTDDFGAGLSALMNLPWGKKAVRIAIAVGEDANQDILQQFIGISDIQPLQANNADQLVRYIKWVSTAVLKSASSPASQVNNANPSGVNVPIPALPEPSSAADVW